MDGLFNGRGSGDRGGLPAGLGGPALQASERTAVWQRRADRGSGVLRRPSVLAALVVFGSLAAVTRAQEPVRVTCPVVADATVFSAVTNESAQNLGGAQVLQTRGNRCFVLLRFDLTPADGLLVTGATLRLRRVENLLTRVGVSTIAAGADWPEGTATQPKMTPGAVCFRHVAYHQDRREARYWARPGSDVSDVVFANGGSRWVPRVAEFDRASRWYEIDIPPEFVQAMMLGLQPGGLCLSDDFGRNAAAPTFCSRESQDPPVLMVTGQRTAPVASQPPEDVRTQRDALGAEWVTFSAPRALGFEIYLSKKRLDREEDLSSAVKLDAWAMPAPGAGPRRALLSLHRSAPHRYVAVRAVEMGGQWSPLVSAELPPPVAGGPAFTAPELKRFDLPQVFDRPFTMDDGPALSEDGRWVRTAGQTWWNPRRGPISLQTGRNEFVAFQIILAGGPGTYVVTLADWTSPGASEPAPRVQLYRQHYVKSRLGREKYAPDAALPLLPSESLRLELLTPEQNAQPRTQPARRRVVQGIWADIYVPHKAARGTWRTRVIVLRDGRALLDIPLELEVIDLTLPDELGFQVSLGSDKLPGPLSGVAADSPESWDLLDDYHRLAHEHRVTLTIVPYGADGKVHPGFAPVIEPAENGPKLDWADWDRRFGRYLDGSAFGDLPREAVPLAHFCLPLHENWPMLLAFKRAPARSPLAGKYHFRDTPTEFRRGQRPGPPRGSYMAWPIENAFSGEYREGTAAVLRGFAKHLAGRGWDNTEFLLYLHNKCSYKETGSWWDLREPAIHDDFLALGFWLGMYRQAPAGSAPSSIQLRADIAQPQFQRDTLDGLVDLAVLNEMFFAKNRLVLSHPERYPRRWLACDTLAPEVGWSEALKRGWAARLAGAGGLACRRSLGADEDWDAAREAALLYPGARFGHRGPYPSLRLKALRRVQQDMDWLGQWVARVQAAGTAEGYALSVVGAALATRSKARLPYRVTLLPNLEFPGRLDTVAFEEIRRGLRRALLD